VLLPLRISQDLIEYQVAWLSQNAEVLVSGSEATADCTMQVAILPTIEKGGYAISYFAGYPPPSSMFNNCRPFSFMCRSIPLLTWKEISAGSALKCDEVNALLQG